MRQGLTPDDLFALVLLMRSADHRTLILVEGPSDSAVLDPHIDSQHCVTIPGHGKNNVVAAVRLSNGQHVDAVVGVVDADFHGLVGETRYPDNLITTELYDLDAELFFSDNVVARVINAFANHASLSQHMQLTQCGPPEDVAVNVAAAIGALRYIAASEGLSLNLSRFPVQEVVDAATASCDLYRLVLLAFRRSSAPGINPTWLMDRLADVMAHPPAPARRLCCGHDLSAALGHFMRREWGARMGADQVERTMRAAIGCDAFRNLSVRKKLARWAEAAGVSVWHGACAGLA